MKKIGFVGWRGMVGSVLMERMTEFNDFNGISPLFFTTSQVGEPAPPFGEDAPPLISAHDLDALSSQEIIVTCQGGAYTKEVLPKLRDLGWEGYWVDAASAMRMDQESVIVLDPTNRHVIDQALNKGIKNFIGGNCTVSLMLMAVGSLLEADLVEWMSTMTYQAASGAGARGMLELIKQFKDLGEVVGAHLLPSASALKLDGILSKALRKGSLDVSVFQAPLAASLIPWIDSAMPEGETREEWKGFAETNKILALEPPVPVDGLCVRVGAMRSHAQALTIKLKKDLPLHEVEARLAESNPWVKVVENNPEATRGALTPAAVSGTLDVPVGRIRKMKMGPRFLTAFTVGDQLLWGAAEPLRRMLKILRGQL